jgi:hypothetical protein
MKGDNQSSKDEAGDQDRRFWMAGFNGFAQQVGSLKSAIAA